MTTTTMEGSTDHAAVSVSQRHPQGLAQADHLSLRQMAKSQQRRLLITGQLQDQQNFMYHSMIAEFCEQICTEVSEDNRTSKATSKE